jgi:hypothetical protein
MMGLRGHFFALQIISTHPEGKVAAKKAEQIPVKD